MAKPASMDLRKRVVLAVMAGDACRAVAKRFNVAPSNPSKWTRHYLDTGSFAPCKMGGHRCRPLEPHKAWIMERIAKTPHITVHAHPLSKGRGYARPQITQRC